MHALKLTQIGNSVGVILPREALARLKLPIPLGGTSNFFRRDALQKVGGWDAWNVTEDIDLGLRLARLFLGQQPVIDQPARQAANEGGDGRRDSLEIGCHGSGLGSRMGLLETTPVASPRPASQR